MFLQQRCWVLKVDAHHKQFIACYPSASIIPKMRYMVHFLSQILRQVYFYDIAVYY